MSEFDDVLWEDQGSVFRPSYSSTSLFCAGSLIPSMSAPDTAGYDAAVGTVFHEVIAEFQLNGRPDHWLGETRIVPAGEENFTVEIDEEMFIHAEECLARVADRPGDRYVETRVDISSLTPIPGQGGTCDLAICQPGLLEVVDWKFGKGIQVFAHKNTQLLCYAWGFFTEYDSTYDFQTIRLRIAQPRIGGGHFDVWEITREELIEFADWARERWAAAWKPNADRTPGPKQCLWCKVRLPCAAFEQLRQAMADQSFDVLDEPVSHEQQLALVHAPIPASRLVSPTDLTTEHLARIRMYRSVMEKWFKDIDAELISRGFQGDDLGGLWKVAEGRSRRKWRDEEQAVAGLARVGVPENQIYERKLVSPNQSEKLLRAAGVRGALMKSYLKLLVEWPPGRPTLVPIGDNRSNLGSIVDDSFEEVEGGDEL